MAEGGCGLDHGGRRLRLTGPHRLSTEAGMQAMPAPVRVILRSLDVTEFVELHR